VLECLRPTVYRPILFNLGTIVLDQCIIVITIKLVEIMFLSNYVHQQTGTHGYFRFDLNTVVRC